MPQIQDYACLKKTVSLFNLLRLKSDTKKNIKVNVMKKKEFYWKTNDIHLCIFSW